ncbi:Guanylate cyclase 2G [Lemmus lemmus]
MRNWLTLFSLHLVIILICSSEDAKSILQAAENLELHTGEFAFILCSCWRQGSDSFWKELLRNDKVTGFPKVYESVSLIAPCSYGDGTGDGSSRKQRGRGVALPKCHCLQGADCRSFVRSPQGEEMLYAPVGLCQDVLRNSDHEMDWMFKLSFAYDIINMSITETNLKNTSHSPAEFSFITGGSL